MSPKRRKLKTSFPEPHTDKSPFEPQIEGVTNNSELDCVEVSLYKLPNLRSQVVHLKRYSIFFEIPEFAVEKYLHLESRFKTHHPFNN